MTINFLEDDVLEVARNLPDLMEEVDTNYEFRENHSGYEKGPEGENMGATAKFSVSVPEENIPYSRDDLEREFGASANLQVWDLSSIESFDSERKAQLYVSASRTTPREEKEEEAENLYELLSTDIEEVMTPEPDTVEYIESNNSEVYRWDE